jgi:hypothetical protein
MSPLFEQPLVARLEGGLDGSRNTTAKKNVVAGAFFVAIIGT